MSGIVRVEFDAAAVKPTTATAAIQKTIEVVSGRKIDWREALRILESGYIVAVESDAPKVAEALQVAGLVAQVAAAEPDAPYDPPLGGSERALKVALALMAQSEGNPLTAAAYARTLRTATGDDIFEDVIDALANTFSPWLDGLIEENGLRAGGNT